MFQKLVSSGLALSLALSFGGVSGEAQAAPIGGGRSFGFSRSFSMPSRPVYVPPVSAPKAAPQKTGSGGGAHDGESRVSEHHEAPVAPSGKDTKSATPLAAARAVNKQETHQGGGSNFWTWYWWSQAMTPHHTQAAVTTGSTVKSPVPKAEMNAESCMRAELIAKFGMSPAEVTRRADRIHDLKIKFDGLPSGQLGILGYSAASLEGKTLQAYRDCAWQ